MNNHDVDQDLQHRPIPRAPWAVSLGGRSPCLLLAVAVALIGLDRLVPKRPNFPQPPLARVDWYLRSGQCQADGRTLAAMFRYLAAAEPAAPSPTLLTDLAVAEAAPTNLPAATAAAIHPLPFADAPPASRPAA